MIRILRRVFSWGAAAAGPKRLFHLVVTLGLFGCSDPPFANFGDLDTPISLAMHRPSGHLFIASHGSDQLRVLVPREGHFLVAPAALFPLSIPTVPSPIAVAAADRYVFVVSGAGGGLGFVDTRVPEGGVGPRSVDGPDGFPLSLELNLVPTAALAFAAAYPYEDELADHLLVVGLSPDGEGGSLVAARPPNGEASLPSVAATLALEGIFPAAVALDPSEIPAGSLGETGGEEIVDCRTVALADSRLEEGHRPGIWLSKVRVQPDGSFSIDPFTEAGRIELQVPVTLASGAVEERLAGVRDLAFAPAPGGAGLEEALADDPCAQRSGRLFVVLDPAYCSGAASCPNVAVVDLGGDPTAPGALATDAAGGPAVYTLPGAQLEVIALAGPLNIAGAYDPHRIDEESGSATRVEDLSVLALFTSTNGAITYLAGGLGPYLEGPGERASSDRPFLLSSTERGPGPVGAVRRTDAQQLIDSPLAPQILVPPEARPRTEGWTASFGGALPGLEDVGRADSIGSDGVLRVSAGQARSFRDPVLVQSSPDPLLADRVAPQGAGDLVCEGYPVVEVAQDGMSLVVERDAAGFVNQAGCDDSRLRLSILPPKSKPWTLSGSITGFVGRTEGEAGVAYRIFSGDRLLFAFVPPEEGLAEGASFAWAMDSGFRFLQSNPGGSGLMPASMVSFLRDPSRPDWRVYVSYSGADRIYQINPVQPMPRQNTFYR